MRITNIDISAIQPDTASHIMLAAYRRWSNTCERVTLLGSLLVIVSRHLSKDASESRVQIIDEFGNQIARAICNSLDL